MLLLLAMFYLSLGLSQFPILEKQVTRSVADLPAYTPVILKILVWGFSLVFMVLVEPLFSLVFYILKPWVKK